MPVTQGDSLLGMSGKVVFSLDSTALYPSRFLLHPTLDMNRMLEKERPLFCHQIVTLRMTVVSIGQKNRQRPPCSGHPPGDAYPDAWFHKDSTHFLLCAIPFQTSVAVS